MRYLTEPRPVRVARPSRQGGRVAQRQVASSYAINFIGTDTVARFGFERVFRSVEPARRGLLSLRDPPGTNRSVGALARGRATRNLSPPPLNGSSCRNGPYFPPFVFSFAAGLL